jgi:Spy/CpxP family protein refolding chaperone
MKARILSFVLSSILSPVLPACVALLVAVSAYAQVGGQGGGAGAPQGEDRPVTPGEIQRMFDSYSLMQAQDQLKITDEQFPRFLTRFKALQDLRRQALQERGRYLQELRKQLNGPQPDDSIIREQLKVMQELDVRLQADVKRAYEAIDQVLDLRQQAKFRLFEENMERRKLELVTRARQANRPKL